MAALEDRRRSIERQLWGSAAQDGTLANYPTQPSKLRSRDLSWRVARTEALLSVAPVAAMRWRNADHGNDALTRSG